MYLNIYLIFRTPSSKIRNSSFGKKTKQARRGRQASHFSQRCVHQGDSGRGCLRTRGIPSWARGQYPRDEPQVIQCLAYLSRCFRDSCVVLSAEYSNFVGGAEDEQYVNERRVSFYR